MSRPFSKRNVIPFLVAMSLVLIPALSVAGGHGGGHGGVSYSTYYPLRTYSSYYLGAGSLGLYGGLSYYPRSYSYGLGGYGLGGYGLGGYGLGGYGLGGYGLSSLFGLGGYAPLTQVSKDYSVEQSRTYYVPGGSITNSVSKGTEISTLGGLYGLGLYGLGGGLWF